MKKQLFLINAVSIILLAVLLSVSLTSAYSTYEYLDNLNQKYSDSYSDSNNYNSYQNNAPFNHRYQGPSDKSSASYYNYNNYNSGSSSRSYNSNSYNNYNSNSNRVPVFKGSYGNYRYQMYENGDYRPTTFFVDYPDYGHPYFWGGFGGYRGDYGGYGYSYPYYSNYGLSYGYSYPYYSQFFYFGF